MIIQHWSSNNHLRSIDLRAVQFIQSYVSYALEKMVGSLWTISTNPKRNFDGHLDNVHWTSSSQCQVYHVKSSLTESLVKYLHCTVAMKDSKTPVINSLQYYVVVSIGKCFTTDFAVSNNSGVFQRASLNQYFTLASLICDIYVRFECWL